MDSSIRLPAAMRFNDRRLHVRDRILEQAPEARNSVFGRAFAECFVERVAEALSSDAWTPFLSWVDATYRRHAESQPARAVFAAAPVAVANMLELLEAAPELRDEFRCVALEIAAITGNVAGADGETSGALEEIDIALASIVGELRALDPVIADQSQAVSAWSGRIAEKLGLSKEQTAKVTRGGLIHDIGKTTMPKEILLAPRTLTDEEWESMRDHAVAGERMLVQTPLLRPFCPIVRSHHERFDGLGYPDGLDSQRIPLPARITAVADAFTAMIGARCYRPAMAPEAALEELKRCKGSQFDPNVVDAMFEIVNGGTDS